MISRSFILLLVLSAAMIGSVSAINSTISAEQVSSYSIVPPTDYIIYSIIIDPVPIGINQSHVLNYNGQVYLLTIGTTSTLAIYHTFDISLTEPNGNTSTVQLTHVGVQQNYKTTIQPIYLEMQSISNPLVTIDLYAGLTPLTAAFNTVMMTGYNRSTAIPFTAASGTLGTVTNVFCEIMTMDEFQNNVVNWDPFNGITRLGSQVVEWTWTKVLGLFNAIPVIGPMFVSIMSAVGTIGGEILFWLLWFIENLPAMIAAVEVTICMFAFIMAGKNPKPEIVAKNIYNYNVAAVMGIVGGISVLVSWLAPLMQVIAAVIEIIKRII